MNGMLVVNVNRVVKIGLERVNGEICCRSLWVMDWFIVEKMVGVVRKVVGGVKKVVVNWLGYLFMCLVTYYPFVVDYGYKCLSSISAVNV
jgi:hypothetical protein